MISFLSLTSKTWLQEIGHQIVKQYDKNEIRYVDTDVYSETKFYKQKVSCALLSVTYKVSNKFVTFAFYICFHLHIIFRFRGQIS